jgi:hypothetical protein
VPAQAAAIDGPTVTVVSENVIRLWHVAAITGDGQLGSEFYAQPPEVRGPRLRTASALREAEPPIGQWSARGGRAELL